MLTLMRKTPEMKKGNDGARRTRKESVGKGGSAYGPVRGGWGKRRNYRATRSGYDRDPYDQERKGAMKRGTVFAMRQRGEFGRTRGKGDREREVRM